MHTLKKIILILLISIFAFRAYSYKLGEIPNGVYVDEAVTGINSYSILSTGKDENGKSFPTLFRFFGSYSPPLYVYLSVIPIFFLGLSAESIRITSVFCGALMLLVIWRFLKQSDLYDKKIIFPSVVLFLITPWNYFYARTGYEIYLGFTIYSLGCLFLWFGIKNKIYLFWGLITLSVSLYGAHAQLFSVPLLLSLFLICFFKQLNKRFLIYGILIGVLIQIPRILLVDTKAFLNKGDLFYGKEIILNSAKINLPDFISVPLSFLFSFFARTTSYFSPESLFLLSDPDPQRSIPELSVFYSWMVIPYLIGLIVLFLNLKKDFIKYLIILIFASVIPIALTGDPFSSQRTLPLLMPLFLIICFGISVIYKKIGNIKFLLLSSFVLFFSIFLLWRSYFILLPAERAAVWNYEYKQLAQEVEKRPEINFVIEDVRNKPAYSEMAFYLKINPEVLQNAADQKIKEDYYNETKFNTDINFENMSFRKIFWEDDIYKKQILVGGDLTISENQQNEHFLDKVFTIKDPRGYTILSGFMTNPEKKCQSINNASSHCPKK